jgi:methionyl-tRNA formyltransferase
MSDSRIVMLGCHELGGYLLPRLVDDGFRPECVVTADPGSAAGISGYQDLRPIASELGIPSRIVSSLDMKAPEDRQFFGDQAFSVLIQGGWPRLIPAEVLSSLTVGAVGVHGGPDRLPKGRGRSPLNWALIEGRKRFLLQFFLMTPGVDDGPVFDVEPFDITPFDTIATLYMKNAIATRRVLGRSLVPLIEGSLPLHPQIGEPTYYRKRTPADGRIDWDSMDVWAIHDFVRAQTKPYPGAFARIGEGGVRIWRAQVFDTRLTYPQAGYGEVVERFGDSFVVNCLGGLLLVQESEPVFGSDLSVRSRRSEIGPGKSDT